MSDYTYMQAEFLRRQIEQLVMHYPELEDDEQLRADVLEGETDLNSVMSRIVARMRDADAMAQAVKLQVEQMNERKARWTRQKDAMRSLAQCLMEAARAKKLVLPEATLSIRTVAPSVQIIDESAIPEDYAVYERKIDKVALKQGLMMNDVPGAAMSNGGMTISVRFT